MRTGQFHRGKTGCRHTVGAEMRSRDQNGAGRGDKVSGDICLADRHISAVLTIENQRKLFSIANAQQHKGGQPFIIGDDITCINTLIRQCFTDESAHMLITDTRDDCRF